MFESTHVPVLLFQLLKIIRPINGIWLDGTFGAGGYTRGLLDAGADHIIAIDRDPNARLNLNQFAPEMTKKISFTENNYCDLDKISSNYTRNKLAGIVLDIGVSSMQLDQYERGFSFKRDGPLDMRMSQSGPSAKDFINKASEKLIADVLFYYGEERASRRIANAIVEERKISPILTTKQLASIIQRMKTRKKGQLIHPATQSFQAIRVAINNELENLFNGLMAAERALSEGGVLAVVTFHSLEDRIVKRFLQVRSKKNHFLNKIEPTEKDFQPSFELINKKPIQPDKTEVSENARSRSGKLRLARRLSGGIQNINSEFVGIPIMLKEMERFKCA